MLISSRAQLLLSSLILLWVISLTILSLLPLNRAKLGTQPSNGSIQTGIAAKHTHRLAHWVAFGVPSLLAGLLVPRLAQRLSISASLVSLGVAIEWLQHLIFAQPLETWDICDDAYATLAGFFFACALVGIAATSGSQLVPGSNRP